MVYFGSILIWIVLVNVAARVQHTVVLGLAFDPAVHIIPTFVGVFFGVVFARALVVNRRHHASVLELEAREAAIADLNEQLAEAIRETEESLRDTQKHLVHSQKSESLGRLASGIVHDSNNIFTTILAGVGLLAENADEADIETIELIRNACNGAAKLNMRLLSFARRHEEEARPIDVAHALEEMIPMFGMAIDSAIKLETNIPPQPVIVSLGEGVLEQVVLNLVVNAADAIDESGVISIGVGTRQGQAVISVEDDGRGMDAETQARAFEHLFTTKGENGTGLGLAVVRSSLERYGGTVEFDSTPGEGTRFIISLELFDLDSIDHDIMDPSRAV